MKPVADCMITCCFVYASTSRRLIRVSVHPPQVPYDNLASTLTIPTGRISRHPYRQCLVAYTLPMVVTSHGTSGVSGEQTHLARFGRHRRPRIDIACFTQSTVSLPVRLELLQCGAEIIIKHHCLRFQEVSTWTYRNSLAYQSQCHIKRRLRGPVGTASQVLQGALLWLARATSSSAKSSVAPQR